MAVADFLTEDGHEVSLILSGTRKAEEPVAQSWKGPLLKSGARPIKDPRNLLAILRCRKFLKEQGASILLATGGYTSFAPVIAARWLGIPVILHEANSLAGRAVKFLAKHCKIEAVATSFKETAMQLPGVKTVYTGLPLRRSVLEALERAQEVAREEGHFSVLVTGGSQGAHGMNLLVAPILASLAKSDAKVRITHQCGAADIELMRATYAEVAEQVQVVPFIEDMGAAYGQADLVIARAGAATCFELARCAVPTIFIPLPTAADDHQTKNAEALVRCGGALCFDQLKTAPVQFADAVRQLYTDAELRQSMRDALKRLPAPDATRQVVELLLASITYP